MVILLVGGTLNTVTAMVSETLESAGVGTSDENSQSSTAKDPKGNGNLPDIVNCLLFQSHFCMNRPFGFSAHRDAHFCLSYM